jgi:aminoglycoside 3-N-acetyltransferase I
MPVEIKKLHPPDIGQFVELVRVFEEVFEMENFRLPPQDHLQQLLNKDDFMVFVALAEGNVIGGLTAYTLIQYYSRQPLVYVYDLAVAAAWQRKGIGKRLMSAITGYCRERGVEEVFVQADRIDEHAVAFYHSTGATAEDVIHFYYPLSEK